MSDLPPRYRRPSIVDRGAFGAVMCAWDSQLQHEVMIKLAISEDNDIYLEDEARMATILNLTGVVRVMDTRRYRGRTMMVMAKAPERSLCDLILELHGPKAPRLSLGALERGLASWGRLVETVAALHRCGVLFSDLKPEHVRWDDARNPVLLDWGGARLHLPERATPQQRAMWERRHRKDHDLERPGAMGTIPYQAPEQAWMILERIGLSTDVYALGVMGWEMITGERLPRVPGGRRPPARWPPEPLSVAFARRVARDEASDAPTPVLSPALVAIVERALAWDPADRFADASELAAALGDWLSRGPARQDALARFLQARALEATLEAQRAATRRLQAAPPLDEDAVHLAHLAEEETEAQLIRLLHTTFVLAPEFPEVLDMLVRRHLDRLRAADGVNPRAEREHIEAIRALDERGRYAEVIRGAQRLHLPFVAPPTELRLIRVDLRGRRAVETSLCADDVNLTRHPDALELTLEPGSYLLEIGRDPSALHRMPLRVLRFEPWSMVPPESRRPVRLRLPEPGDLAPDEVWVPAGYAWLGGDELASDGQPRRRYWFDSFVIQRDPVRLGDYLRFLDDMVVQVGMDATLAQLAPLAPGAPSVAAPRDGRFIDLLDGRSERGYQWSEDMPVVGVTWRAAMAYARWLGARTGHAWRLPLDLEWELAARGRDERCFPWGHGPVESLANFLQAIPSRERTSILPVGVFATDTSPFGVRDMAGNTRDWCLNPYFEHGLPPEQVHVRPQPAWEEPAHEQTRRVLKGGDCRQSSRAGRLAGRYHWPERGAQAATFGFRLVRPWLDDLE